MTHLLKLLIDENRDMTQPWHVTLPNGKSVKININSHKTEISIHDDHDKLTVTSHIPVLQTVIEHNSDRYEIQIAVMDDAIAHQLKTRADIKRHMQDDINVKCLKHDDTITYLIAWKNGNTTIMRLHHNEFEHELRQKEVS